MGQGLTDSTELRTQLYVDDPCSTVRGTAERSDRLVTILIIFWLVLGWRLAYHKGQYGRQIEWVGYSISINASMVEAKINEGFTHDLRSLVNSHLADNLIFIAQLRSFAGKANHDATLVYTWRPFLDQRWAAIAGTKPSGAPRGKIWVKQIAACLK